MVQRICVPDSDARSNSRYVSCSQPNAPSQSGSGRWRYINGQSGPDAYLSYSSRYAEDINKILLLPDAYDYGALKIHLYLYSDKYILKKNKTFRKIKSNIIIEIFGEKLQRVSCREVVDRNFVVERL